jgi:hypothetical protein
MREQSSGNHLRGESQHNYIKECSSLKTENEKLKLENSKLVIQLQSTCEELNMIQEEHCRTEMFLRDHIKDLVVALGRAGNPTPHKFRYDEPSLHITFDHEKFASVEKYKQEEDIKNFTDKSIEFSQFESFKTLNSKDFNNGKTRKDLRCSNTDECVSAEKPKVIRDVKPSCQ